MTGIFAAASAIASILFIRRRKKGKMNIPTSPLPKERVDDCPMTKDNPVGAKATEKLYFDAAPVKKAKQPTPTGRFLSHFSGINYLGTIDNPYAVAISPVDRSIRRIDLHPDCIEIAVYAFRNCEKLESISIPTGVSMIGFGAFGGCDSLERVEIEDLSAWCHISFNCRKENYSANPLCYADKLFVNGEEVKHVNVPEGITELSCCALSTSGLRSVTLPSTLTQIGSFAFDNCFRLQSICIPAKVKKIGEAVFYDCEGLREITVQEENPVFHSSGNCLIETASKTLIAGCATSVIPDDGSVISIGAHAFSGCLRLAELVIPATVNSIGASAFYGCTDLKELALSLPNGTSHLGEIFATDSDVEHQYFVPRKLKGLTLTGEEIPAYAVRDCDGILRATIGASVNRIGAGAFEGCQSLASVVFEDPDGWSVGETSLNTDDLSNPSTAATHLTQTYTQNTWVKR